MHCTQCAQPMRVVETRPRVYGVRRRYECDCGHKLSTVEQVVERHRSYEVMESEVQDQLKALREQVRKLEKTLGGLIRD